MVGCVESVEAQERLCWVGSGDMLCESGHQSGLIGAKALSNAEKFKGGKFQAPKNLKKTDFFVFSGAHNSPEPLCTYLDVHSQPEHDSPLTPYGRNSLNKY